MKQRTSETKWIPFWGDKWLFGSMRIEFDVAERGVWWDLMALAMKDDGFIRANEDTPYPSQQLAGMLLIEEKFLMQTIQKFVKAGKLTQMKNGTLFVTNWNKYRFTDRHQRRFKDKNVPENGHGGHNSGHLDKKREDKKRIEKNKKEIYKEKVQEILNYLNEKTGKNFRTDSQGFINARLEEGYQIEDFEKVIDVKCQQWLRDEKMNQYLRPSTLFRKSHFDEYLNEMIIKKQYEIADYRHPYWQKKEKEAKDKSILGGKNV